MRFLQTSDFHLDSLPGAGRLNLPPDLREQLRRDVRAAAARALALAREGDCDIALLPGDLFDDETAKPDTIAFLKEQLATLAPIPVLIAPGNHDYLSPASPYAEENWPGNVRIFRHADFAALDLWDRELSVVGYAQVQRGATGGLGDHEIPKGECPRRLLCFHGARQLPGLVSDGKTLPFSDDLLLGLGFDYAAIGHYHFRTEIVDGEGMVRGAYAGCTQGRGLDETGVKGALIGEIDGDGRVRVEFVRTCVRVVHSAKVDVTGAEHSGQIEARVGQALEALSPPPMPEDFLHVVLFGRLAAGVEIPPAEALKGPYAHLALETAIRPEYDLDELRQRPSDTLKARFVAAIDETIAATADEREKQLLTNAIYYGLEALQDEKIEPRYEGDVD
jgi:exonuclease SbcD